MLITGGAALLVHLLFRTNLQTSALLYVAIPYLLALLIAAVRPYKPDTKWYHKYLSFMTTTIVAFLASALILMEGFICVIAFMPILLIVVTLAFITDGLVQIRDKYSTHFSFLLPLIVLVSSLEGTHEDLSFDRKESVTVTHIAPISADAIRQHMSEPMELARPRNWLLQLFPMPYEIHSEDFHEGAVHTAKTRYHRWFVTNTHEGEMQLQILELTDNRLRTQVVKDTSHFANYITLKGSEINWRAIANERAEVQLTLFYERDLDPAWYFAPLQRYAMEHMAHLLIREVITRA